MRQAFDKFECVCGDTGGVHLIGAGIGTTKAHVLGDAGGKDHRVLRHQCNRAAHILRGALLDVDAVEQDAARLRIVKTQQQGKQGGFAGPGRTDQRHTFARLNGK